jgi:hypothetical protein
LARFVRRFLENLAGRGMSEQGAFPVCEVRQLRRLLAVFVSAKPELNIHHNNVRKISCEIQGYEAVNFASKEFDLFLV